MSLPPRALRPVIKSRAYEQDFVYDKQQLPRGQTLGVVRQNSVFLVNTIVFLQERFIVTKQLLEDSIIFCTFAVK